MSIETIRISHPLLGSVIGRDGEVVSFRGIPYGTLKDRLSEPQLCNQYSSPVDATKFGPVSPHPPGAFQLEMTLMQQSLPDPPDAYSDLGPLNLNIWVPKIDGQFPKPQSLPVFVWIHGGGFVSGAGSWPQYDLARLVKLSTNKNMPIVGVTINFRLGLPGYLTSSELRDAGYKPNNQLRDQRTALYWLKQYIGGFGGTAEEITVAGESTGAVDIGLHLQSDEPLFARALMTGGSSLLMPPSTPEHQEEIYNKAMKALGIGATNASERIEELVSIPYQEIIAKLSPPLPYRPMVDGELVPCPATYAMVAAPNSTEIGAKRWLKGLMVGDCQFDASSMAIFMAHLKPGISKSFPQHLRKNLGNSNLVLEELLGAYGFTTTSLDDDTAFKRWLEFINDLCYHAATVSFSQGWHSNCYTFLVNEMNPWPGMFQGEATHIMDAILLFQNFNHDLPPAMRAASQKFGTDVLAFVHGVSPWPSCDGESRPAKVYGPSSWDADANEPSARIVQDFLLEDTGRRHAMISMGTRIGLDELAAACSTFFAS